MTLARPYARGAHAPVGTIGPSCSGRAHSKCLLSADTCSCPCHRGLSLPRVEIPRRFRCALCTDAFTTELDRQMHVHDAHQTPIAVDAPSHPNEHRFGCPYCMRRFTTQESAARHIVAIHARAKTSSPREGGSVPSECAPLVQQRAEKRPTGPVSVP